MDSCVQKAARMDFKNHFFKQMMRYVETCIKERSRENTLDVVKVVGRRR